MSLWPGCDGVLVSIPCQNDDQYRAAVREVAATAPPFLMLQDWDPQGYGVPVRTLVIPSRVENETNCPSPRPSPHRMGRGCPQDG